MIGRSIRWLPPLTLLALAALACNAAGFEGPDAEATNAAVYATITAQAATAGIPQTASGERVTATPPPANTPATGTPTVSPTAPAERTGNGPRLAFPPCGAALTVDGDLADWLSGEGAVFSLDAVTYGATAWSGADDLSGQAQACWTGDALYLFVEVTDNAHVQTQTGGTQWQGDEVELVFDADLSGQARACWTGDALYLFVEVTDNAHVQTQTGGTQWQGDEVELVFDADLAGDFYEEEWDADDTQLGLSPGDFADLPPTAVVYRPAYRAAPEVEVAARQPLAIGGNYTLEARIPWTVFGVQPEGGDLYGFCLALSDNDQPGEASQDSMASHCPGLVVSRPVTWTTLELTP
jgi:hypothetical protein